MDICDIFDTDPLSLALIACSTVALFFALLTILLYFGPTLQYARLTYVVAITRARWVQLEEQAWLHRGYPSQKWLDTLTNLEKDVERHSDVVLRPLCFAQVPSIWSNISESIYLTWKAARLHGRLQEIYLPFEKPEKALDSPV